MQPTQASARVAAFHVGFEMVAEPKYTISLHHSAFFSTTNFIPLFSCTPELLP
jgi:hypothetical protein